jgi:chromosome segregation ATPase
VKDESLANLSPDGPPRPRAIEAHLSRDPPLPSLEIEVDEIELEVIVEEEPEPGVDAVAIMEIMGRHQKEMSELQGELRRVDVERSRAEAEAQSATGILKDSERRLRELEADLRDERTRYDVAQQRAQLMEQANALPWWNWSVRKEFLRRAQSLSKALPAP